MIDLLGRLELAANRLEQIKDGHKIPGLPDERSALGAYRQLANTVIALNAGDHKNASRYLSEAREHLGRDLDVRRSTMYAALLMKWERETNGAPEPNAQQPNKDIAGRGEAIRAKLAAIRNATDLEQLIATIEQEARTSTDGTAMRLLGNQLAATASAWRRGQPEVLQSANDRDVYGEAGWTIDLGPLRSRIQRELLAILCRVPEINTPPLSELSPDKAIDRIIDELQSKGDWHRLLEVVEARENADRRLGHAIRPSDLRASLRDFIAAQNFELAEEWVDASLAYKSVLRATSDRAPVKEAAALLKALNKNHPIPVLPPPSTPSSAPPAPAPEKR